jgi:hypothetical protein
MHSTTNDIVPPYDFAVATRLAVADRIARSMTRARMLLNRSGYQRLCSYPCVPARGASDDELLALERELETPLPPEYRTFLARHRYLKLNDGYEVGGFDHEGLYVTESPWVSPDHRAGASYLVFANYWRYADGDQLMFDLSESEAPVIAYLHEHGPRFELYAPSFSLALWRLVHEE